MKDTLKDLKWGRAAVPAESLDSPETQQPEAEPATLDLEALRAEFPVLHQEVHGQPLVYLDNAASSQKPRAVLEAMRRYYEHDHANVHRGVHTLSVRATEAYEAARAAVRRHLNAAEDREIVFLRGCTEAINLVANAFGALRVDEGDEVVITHMEHHSNIVPWQMLCERRGARLRVAPIDERGELPLDELEALFSKRTRLVGVVHVSNSLGTVNPVGEIVRRAHARDIPVLIDGAQAVPHLPIDVRALDCDFYVFSGHKAYGPTGVGALYAKRAWLDRMPPWQGGGDMIRRVSFERTTYAPPPARFEAGTPNIAGAVGLQAALEWMERVGVEAIARHEADLLAYATQRLEEVPGLRIVGTAADKASVLSFTMEGVHPHDVGTVLDQEGIAVRTGHHCTQPVMDFFGVPATSRASFAAYNTRAEVDRLAEALLEAREVFG